MGLDMYLEGKKFYWAPRNKEDNFEVKEKTLEVGYWRKHPNLHGFIVKTFAEGVDDCKPVELSVADLQKILAAVRGDDLPETEGFFFGTSSDEDKQPSIDILTKAIEWATTEEKGVSRYVVYRASW